ncbi:MAG: glycosyltransferase family 4 protein [candidate division WWE3 bacterium]|nr:glycosyltransferase family 4 protein [candidate division WWE3 bacterium]
MENHTLDLVRGMVKKGADVWVLCSDGEMVSLFEKAGAHVIIDRIRSDFDFAYIRRLVIFLKSRQIDIIHGHELKAGLNALIAGYLAKTPLKIIHIHTPLSQWQVSPLKKKLNIAINRFITNKLADKVIALTESIKDVRIKEEGIESSKIVVIGNGVDLSQFPIVASSTESNPDKPFVVGYLGRMTEEKGHDVLIKGFAEFLQNFKSQPADTWPRLLLASTGHLEESLKKLAEDLGIRRNVSFLGAIPEDKKSYFYGDLDVFVFPSLAEGFGIVLLEAMAASTACLVSDLPVLKEVGDGSVLTFKVEDPLDLSQKLYSLFRDASRRSDLGRKARDRVASLYTLDKFWDNYAKLYGI